MPDRAQVWRCLWYHRSLQFTDVAPDAGPPYIHTVRAEVMIVVPVADPAARSRRTKFLAARDAGTEQFAGIRAAPACTRLFRVDDMLISGKRTNRS